MRTIIKETTVYTFDELTPNAQEKAIENLWDINVGYEWWDSVYDDAEWIGLKITSFDLDRNRHATGKWLWSALDSAHKIIDEHGEHCETYRTAQDYFITHKALVTKYSDGTDQIMEDNEWDFDQECDEIDAEFLRSLLEDYAIILQKEYEHLTSEEAIREAIEANEYEFTAEGGLY